MKNLYLFATTIVFLALWALPAQAQDLSTDSLALVDLYDDCGGANWTGYDTWLNGPIGTWEGVTVDSALQRVSHVSFKGMNLTGSLPASLGNMDEMSGKIEFHDDTDLTGTLPAFLWNWTKVDRFQLKRSGITAIDTTGMSGMVNLTEYNTEANPISGMVPGVIFTLPAMEKIYLHNCEYDALPPELTMLSGMTRLYLNGNQLTDIPDMSGMTWGSGAKIRFQDNALTFEDLEMNMPLTNDANVAEFNYSPQAMVGTESYTYPAAGDPVSLMSNVGGTSNVYTWIKDGTPVGSMANYDIAAFDADMHSGTYYALVQNSAVMGLDITTANTSLFASALDQDSLALVDLYNTCGGTNWVGFDTWLNGPLASWEGVTVDSATQRVTHVAFKTMNLTGTLNTSLGNLTQMGGKIEFHDDSLLTGELPAAIWKWVNVERFQLKRSGVSSIDLTGIENMVNLTEYNTEANPIAGSVPGVIFTLPVMQKIYVHDCEYDAVPSEISMATRLDRLYFNGNNLEDLPDLSGMQWGDDAKIRVQDNHLTFEDLESNVVIGSDSAVAEFNYSPQANVGMATTYDLATGDSLMLSIPVGGTSNMYTWIKDGTPVGSDMLYEVNGVSVADVGFYQLLVQNANVPGLDIFSETQQVNVDGTTSIDELSYFGDIRVLGNPVNTNLRIEAEQLIEEVHILDLSGKQITGESVRNYRIDLPVAHLAPGIYYVVLRSGDEVHNLKVVKQ
ncbi:MAG: T9SS type A sorting domain-containing protein [Bacteroidota bacterium]